MPQKEMKYLLTSKNPEGIGAIHTEAICHMAYATALDSLGMSGYLKKEQIKSFSVKKTELKREDNEISLDIRIPVKRDLNMYELMEKTQKEVRQSFADFLSINIKHINLIIDQVVV